MEKKMRSYDYSLEQIANMYMNAKFYVIDHGFVDEIDWQEEIEFEHVDETWFLKEIAWVILSSGMREAVVKNKFHYISKAFYDWTSSERIIINKDKCYYNSLSHFNNKLKISAVISIAEYLYRYGFETVKNSIRREGIDYLTTFPFIGPTTSYHLAKNLGLEVAKPDRHLKRIADKFGYEEVNTLCSEISKVTGEKIAVVDLVLWRFATLNNHYLDSLDALI